MFKKFIGDKHFYKTVLAVAVPIMIQNGITNFVALLDNIMVGQIGTEQMSGTAIANQILFVFNLCIFGILSGPGIYGAQFFGKGSSEGVRQTFRFKLIVSMITLTAGLLILTFFGKPLVMSYLTGSGEEGDKALTLQSGLDYLHVMMLGLVPFTVTQMYSSTLRETNKTVPPMLAGMAAVLVNLVLDWVLIFGKFGAPEMGVKGAALATVIARFIECVIVVVWTHVNSGKNPFITGAYGKVPLPSQLVRSIIISGLPLAMNEAMWSAGMATLNQCYSRKGLDVVAATNISSTIGNIFNVVFIALGSTVGIIVGQILGSGDMKKAKDTDTKLIAFTVASGAVTGGIMALLSGIFPDFYNTTDSVKQLARVFITVTGCLMPMHAFIHASYFTLRSGGRTFVTFLFDSVFMWVVMIPTALALVTFTGFDIIPVYILCQLVDIIKVIVGVFLIKKGIWLRNIVAEKN